MKRRAGSGRQVEVSSVEHAGLALVAAEDEAHLARYVLGSVRNKLFGGFARSQPPLGRAEARMAEAFVFGVSAKRLAQRFVSGAWLCRMY